MRLKREPNKMVGVNASLFEREISKRTMSKREGVRFYHPSPNIMEKRGESWNEVTRERKGRLLVKTPVPIRAKDV